jgi:hypothetical protein
MPSLLCTSRKLDSTFKQKTTSGMSFFLPGCRDSSTSDVFGCSVHPDVDNLVQGKRSQNYKSRHLIVKGQKNGIALGCKKRGDNIQQFVEITNAVERLQHPTL